MVTSMLEKAIEIEGLLRIIRDGKPLPETYKLLKAKTASLAMEATALSMEAPAPEVNEESNKAEEETPASAAPMVDFIMATPASEPVKAEVDFTVPEIAAVEKHVVTPKDNNGEMTITVAQLPEEDLDLTEEDDIMLSFDDITEPIQPEEQPMETPSVYEEPEAEPDSPADPDIEPEPEAVIEMEATSEDTPEEADDLEKKGEPTETKKTEATSGIMNQKRRSGNKLKSAFSLNDRFLYARELFNGNMKIFDSTLDFIEGIDEYPLVEDYFYSELDWNPENPYVASFMEVLRLQFEGLRVKG